VVLIPSALDRQVSNLICDDGVLHFQGLASHRKIGSPSCRRRRLVGELRHHSFHLRSKSTESGVLTTYPCPLIVEIRLGNALGVLASAITLGIILIAPLDRARTRTAACDRRVVAIDQAPWLEQAALRRSCFGFRFVCCF
jgi:hypothetical protein